MPTLSVVLAIVASMIVGSVWYSPLAFGNRWMELAGITEERMKKNGPKAMVVMVFCVIVTVLTMQYLFSVAGVSSVAEGMMLAVAAWLGFVGCTQLMHGMFEGKRLELILISALYQLANFLVIGAILSAGR